MADRHWVWGEPGRPAPRPAALTAEALPCAAEVMAGVEARLARAARRPEEPLRRPHHAPYWPALLRSATACPPAPSSADQFPDESAAAWKTADRGRDRAKAGDSG